MKIIRARFEVTTPLFLGGSAADECANTMRPSAIKGALRFWWRALNWSRIRSHAKDDAEALRLLHEEEADLFGHAGNASRAATQASFLLRCKEAKLKQDTNLPSSLSKGQALALQYLLGMGLYNFKSGLKRSYLGAGGTFSLELALTGRVSAAQSNQLRDALLAFGLLGNLGSRARKGFGSLSLTFLEDGGESILLPVDESTYQEQVANLIKGSVLANELPPYTALSKSSVLQIAGGGSDPVQLLAIHGREMGRYRGWGREKKVFNEPREEPPRFKNDHDWAYEIDKGSRATSLPKRAVFGLPHPYNLSQGGNVTIDVSFDNTSTRRASPLFAHVHKLPSGDYLLVHCLMPAVFLPAGAKVKVGGKNAKSVDLSAETVNSGIDWNVLHDFLERFGDRTMIHG